MSCPRRCPCCLLAYTQRRSGDYDLANPPEVRKYLGTYGLTPPAIESFEVQAQRCLRLLAMKPTPIEKFQYLVHLRATNVHLFYRLLSQNVKVSGADTATPWACTDSCRRN